MDMKTVQYDWLHKAYNRIQRKKDGIKTQTSNSKLIHVSHPVFLEILKKWRITSVKGDNSNSV